MPMHNSEKLNWQKEVEVAAAEFGGCVGFCEDVFFNVRPVACSVNVIPAETTFAVTVVCLQ